MISWKYSLELVSRELDSAEKKKQALNDLLAIGRISQSTHEYLEKELTEAVSDLQAHRKMLVEKMTTRTDALEKQIKSLELFLANLEVHHAAGEIDEETYSRQNQAITLGLEATRKELDHIKDTLTGVVSTTPRTCETPPESPVEVAAPEIPSQNVPESSGISEPIQESEEKSVTAEETKLIETAPEPPSSVKPQEEAPSQTGSENL